ncbi:MAG: rod shape-determining protein MreD [Bryobacteraceae bacterium]
MTDFSSDRLIGTRARQRPRFRTRPLALIAVPLVAILFQVYAPRFLTYLSFLELPLLVTIYFALSWRQPIAGLLAGCVIGLTQDAFSYQPIGIFGIVKTLVGYFAASISQRVDTDNRVIRFGLGAFFYFFHQVTYWILVGTLLTQALPFGLGEVVVFSVLNGLVAASLFGLLDRL